MFNTTIHQDSTLVEHLFIITMSLKIEGRMIIQMIMTIDILFNTRYNEHQEICIRGVDIGMG